MPLTITDVCPRCQVALVAVPDADPWCGSCEWNLDSFPHEPQAGWVWNRVMRWDCRTGFQTDRLLAELSDQGPDAPVPPGGYPLLLGVSAVLMLAMVAAAVGGAWLVLRPAGFGHVVLGLVLLGLAWSLRPRFGSLRKLLRDVYQVPPAGTPALRALVARIAEEAGAPEPDVLAFDFSWNASAAVVGIRRTRVLVLGVPLVLALEPQQLVAVIAHELGHFQYEDGRRALLTWPALSTFGAFSVALRPRRGNAFDLGLISPAALAFLVWQLVGGSLSLLLWAAHIGLHVVNARDSRRVERRADLTAVRAAGSAAMLEIVDLLAMLPELKTYVQHYVPEGEAAATWRRMLAAVRRREHGVAPVVRQHSIRAGASLLASHPTPGRRHQWLSRLPATPPAIVVDPATAGRVEREIAPYAEIMHQTMLDHTLA